MFKIEEVGMNIMLLGAAGFIGTNLSTPLVAIKSNKITLIDSRAEHFLYSPVIGCSNVTIVESEITETTDFNKLLIGQEVVYHLVSTTVPTTSNQHIAQELSANVVMTARMLDAAVKCRVKKIVFLSSGGTVYGKEAQCPLYEDAVTNPISSYGVQKVTIEKLLYLYWYMYGLDYRVIRLANPYGPYQRPDGVQGAVTTFIYKALKGEEITVYGDGTVVRDFIYIDDAINAILSISAGETSYRTFNIGSGFGTSIKQVLETIQNTLQIPVKTVYRPGRKVDVSVNYLDITRYENIYGKLNPIELKDGIVRTADFLKKNYGL